MSMHAHCGRHLPAVLLVALLFNGADMHLWAQAGGAASHDANPKVPAYEVVSIKPAIPGDRNVDWKTLPNGFDFKNLPLAPLIYQAYGITLESQIAGLPEWTKADRYNVSARAGDDTAEAWKGFSKQDLEKQQQLMLQALFADRCQLQVRREVKELPAYDLVIARGGLKMKDSAPDEKSFVQLDTISSYGATGAGIEYTMTMTTHAGTAQGLAQNLPRYAGRIIVDKTGLGDKSFDFGLKWSSSQEAPADSGGTGPSIFTAVEEQLGLKLVPAKEPVDTFVVEHIERPSAN
jgi:uncharacterized protein (TIGR03435 family)